MKRIALFLGVLLVAAACAGAEQSAQVTSDSGSVETTEATATTESTENTTADTTVTETTTAPETTVATEAAPEGPEAPDFTLALRSGGKFTLSEEAKPVYMVFWAEW